MSNPDFPLDCNSGAAADGLPSARPGTPPRGAPTRRRCRVALGALLLAAIPAFAAEDLLDELPQEEFKIDPAKGGLGTIRLDNWGYFQENVNGSYQWQYRPRVFVPWGFASGWIATLRADVPLLYTNNNAPAHTGSGYSGGVGNIFFEGILDTPQLVPNMTVRVSLRYVLESPKGAPFGVGNQEQIAPGAGFTYRMPDVLNGVTFSPFVRWLRGINADQPGTRLISTLQVIPATTFRINDAWAFALYPENPIVYNHNTKSWFAPLDLMFTYRPRPGLEFGFGGAARIGNPSAATYDYIINGRATFFFN
jgi:hypothetical protein